MGVAVRGCGRGEGASSTLGAGETPPVSSGCAVAERPGHHPLSQQKSPGTHGGTKHDP